MQKKRSRAKQNATDGSDNEKYQNANNKLKHDNTTEDENFFLKVLIDEGESDHESVVEKVDDKNPVGADDDETADEERVNLDEIIEAIEDCVNEEIEELIVDIHDVYGGSIWWSRE